MELYTGECKSMHVYPLYAHSKPVSFSFDLRQLRSYQETLNASHLLCPFDFYCF
jgi:hypothetical protein